MSVGFYYYLRSSPVSEGELYDLASAHNRKLRLKYGLPVTQIGVAPYADSNGGGFQVSGRF